MNLQAQKKIIKKLRKMIPRVTCPNGCFKCCTGSAFIEGIALSGWEEQQIIKVNISPAIPKDNSMDIECNYLENGKCRIYEFRPITCRIYGALKICIDECNGKFCNSIPERMVTSDEKIKIITMYAQVYPVKPSKAENDLLRAGFKI